MGAAAAAAGAAAFEVRTNDGELFYRAVTATGVFETPGPGSDALSLAIGTVELLRFGLRSGEAARLVDRTVSADVDGDGRLDTVTVQIDFLVVGFESVTVPAGTFADTARVRSTGVITVTRAAGGTQVVTTVAEEWYASSIGGVRSVATTRITGQADSVQTDELLAYGVGSRRSDTVAPRVSGATPSEGSVVAALTGPVTVRFSEAVDPLSFDGANGLRLLDAAGALVPTQRTVVSALEVWLAPLSALTEGRYTVRAGTGIVDWANNAVAGVDPTFTVDTTAPRLASSEPARDSETFGLTGTLSITLNEDVMAAGGSSLFIEVIDGLFGGVLQRLPATLSGRTVSATVTAPLQRGKAYVMLIASGIADLAGNVLPPGATSVTFRTDPGPLARPTALASGDTIYSVRMADLDGDGLPDLVFMAAPTAGGSPFLGVRPGLAAGGFGSARVAYTLTDRLFCDARALALGDFDGNGRLDVAVSCDGFLRVLLQTTPGNFVSELTAGFNGATALTALDLDGDSRAELAFVGTPPGADIASQNSWFVISRSTAGGWAARTTVALGAYAGNAVVAVVADIDGDGLADLVWSRSTGTGQDEVAWAPRQANGFGAVRSQPIAFVSRNAYDIAVGDIDGDAVPDLVFTDHTDGPKLLLFRGRTGGTFAAAETYTAGYGSNSIAIVDVDGDGRKDLVVNHGSERTVGVFLQSANGRLDPLRRFETSDARFLTGGSLIVVDFDGDGRRDLVVGGDVLLGKPWSQTWPASAKPQPSAAR